MYSLVLQMRTYICLLCSRMACYQSIIIHIVKHHSNQPGDNDCPCGFIGAKPVDLSRHQHTHNHKGQSIAVVRTPIEIMYREVTCKEKKIFKDDRKRRVNESLKQEIKEEVKEQKTASTEQPLESLTLVDYRDWDSTETTEEESWSVIAKRCKTTEEENERLKKKVEELKKISDVLAADMLEPNLGVPTAAALSGFESDWTEAQRHRDYPYHHLFPDPLRQVQSVVVVPDSNLHLTRNQRVWRQSCQKAIRNYNQRHK